MTTTFCVECKHLEYTGADVWYNYFCRASKLKQVVDPVTGNKKYETFNSLGTRILVDNPYRFCRDVNDGHCQLFEERVDENPQR